MHYTFLEIDQVMPVTRDIIFIAFALLIAGRRPQGNGQGEAAQAAGLTVGTVDGTWRQLAFGDKVVWWRQGYIGSEEPQPQLSVRGWRLDVLEKPIVLAGAPATNAYHPDFHWAMLNGFGVPAPGCWEIARHYEGHELRFVVWVAP